MNEACALPDLPVRRVLGPLRTALARHGAAVLGAPPGSGKTTLVPLALLDEAWLGGGRILMLEPRRMAARAAAARMAALLGEAVGKQVGYRVRFERRVSAHTRIEVLTEGMLTRRLQDDPALAGVGLVIFDEFHERNLEADLALALLLDARAVLREDLRLLLMSATLDAAAAARVLGGAPVITGEGERHPVVVRYLERMPAGSVEDTAASAVRRVLREAGGDLLVFLPGGREIRGVAARLETSPETDGVPVCPLYGDLPREEQDRALRPGRNTRRRVVLATNIAETSLTIEGITAVVDSGLARVPRFDPDSALTRLVTTRISRASAEQRAGRAGRLAPGICLRLWTERVHAGMQAHAPAEMLDADLAPALLQLACWGVSDTAALAWMDPPPAAALAQAGALLRELGALDTAGCITAAGRRMARLPVHPRLARMLDAASAGGAGGHACDIAALLEEGDVLSRSGHGRAVDLADHLHALQAWRRGGRAAARLVGVDTGACARVERAARQLRDLLRVADHPGGDPGALLALAYPDRIAQRRPGGSARYLLASGRGARLPEGDPLCAGEYLVVARMDAAQADGTVHLAGAIDRETLLETCADTLSVLVRVAWDAREEAVVARRERRLGALVLDHAPDEAPEPARLRAAMLDGVRRMGLACLPWNETARDWQARVLSLRAWRPGERLPDLSDATLLETLEEWLAPALDGISRRTHLARLDLASLLRGRMDWAMHQRVDEGAPTHLRVPSGSRLHLRYEPGAAPVLAVKLQEMFGIADTPRVCWGEVPVMLHLLSPAGRPVQVTQDLAGFWARTYSEVKKELKGRYPRHPWPDDPLSARPTARARHRPS